MKRFVLISLLIIFAFSASSQKRNTAKWISASLIAEGGNSILFNYAIQHDDNIATNFINTNYAYGGTLGFTFGNDLGIRVEGLQHTFHQSYHITPPRGATYVKRTKFEAIDVSVLLKYVSPAGVYFEIGPRLGMIQSIDIFNESPYKEKIVQDSLYNTNTKSIVAGAGFVLYSSLDDKFRVNFGLRASMAIDDLMVDKSKSIVQDDYYRPFYENTYKTQLFTLTAKVEFVYFFGFYGKSGCGSRRWVFFR